MHALLRTGRGPAARVLAVPALAALLLAAPLAAQPTVWTPLDGPHAAGLRAAAVADDGTLLAATYTDVLRYDGAAWARVASAVNGSIHDVAAVPGGRVWAGTSGALRSLNGGLTWEWFSIRTAPHSGTNPSVLHVAVGPDGTVYAGGYRSADDGASWPQMDIYAAATAFVGATVYAASLPGGVYRSTSGGASWTPSGLAGVAVHHLAATGSRLVAATAAGLLASDDGATWTETRALPQVSGLAVAGDGAVWAAAPDGLYRSPDGLTWAATPAAFAGREVRDVAASGATLLALVEGNPLRSTDGGATWAEVHGGLGFPFATAALAAGGVIAVAASGGGPFASTDGGATWAPWTDGLPGPRVEQLLADPAAGHAFARTHDAAYRAALPGGAWTPIPLPEGLEPTGLATDGAGRLLAVTSTNGFQGKVYRSADGGATWTLAWTEDGTFHPQIAGGGGVAVVTAAGFTGAPRLLVSTDGGVTWAARPHPLAASFNTAPPLFVDAAGRIYLADDHRLHRSSDLGVTWTALGTAGPAGNRVHALRTDAGALCLGTHAGVWCSTDDGATFSAASAGLPGGPVVALVRDGARYVALTEDDGAFASDAVLAGEAGPGGAEGTSLAVAPNPLGGRGAVTLSLDRAEAVTVAVYDALGRRVATLHDGALAAGAHAFTLDAAALAPGLYVVRATSGDVAVARRLVVAR